MKTLILILIGMLVIGSATFFSYTRFNSNETVHVIVPFDKTDSFLFIVEREAIKKLFRFDEDIWQGAIFEPFALSDFAFGDEYRISIPSENRLLVNRMKRVNAVLGFLSEIDTVLGFIDSSIATGRNHSLIYERLGKGLERLQKSSATSKYFIINSDMKENSELMSFYNNSTQLLLQSDPDSIVRIIENIYPLPDLTGIEVFILHKPTSYEKGLLFSLIAKNYGRLLEQKGAKVSIGTSLLLPHK